MLTSTTNLNTAAASTSSLTSTKTAAAQSDAAKSQDRFLKLLVAQLNNQDPMNPMDNAQMTSQMAQINTVSGIQQLNDTMKSMAAQYTAMQTLQGASMVGRDVMTEGNSLSIANNVGKAGVDLSADASQVTVQVLSPGGQLLDTLNLGAMAAGRHNFEWNASSYTGSGIPVFKVSASQGGKAVSTTSLERSTVEAISADLGAMSLTLKTGKSIAYDAIKAIL
ncbi:MAG: flagellar hook assembly protein FlgD [Burkholderiales bacterium]|nr:flagellar hook assembly protein FlgD [Burkholderiales bacterium]